MLNIIIATVMYFICNFIITCMLYDDLRYEGLTKKQFIIAISLIMIFGVIIGYISILISVFNFITGKRDVH